MTRPKRYIVSPVHGVGEITGSKMYQDVECHEIRFLSGEMHYVSKKEFFSSDFRKPCKIEIVPGIILLLSQSRKRRKAESLTVLHSDYRNELKSSDITVLAALVRDLYRKGVGERSGLEREIYESALRKLADELAIVLDVKRIGARGVIESLIERQPLPAEWANALRRD